MENLATLKKRRAVYRRSFTKAEKILQDQAARPLDSLDGACIRSGLDRLEFDVACSQIAQDCILNHLKEEELEAADKENEPHEERSDATVNGLKRLVEAVSPETPLTNCFRCLPFWMPLQLQDSKRLGRTSMTSRAYGQMLEEWLRLWTRSRT